MSDSFARFLAVHLPQPGNRMPSEALAEAYRGRVPDGLIALWQVHGFGFYGERKFAVLDPAEWQDILDRWIVSPATTGTRVPVLMSPVGVLIYYRRIDDETEDYALLDPASLRTDILAYDTDDFWGDVMTDAEIIEDLAPLSILEAGRRSEGALQPGEVYAIDPMMFGMEMLAVARVDALTLHGDILDTIDARQVQADAPDFVYETLADALPRRYRARFRAVEAEGPGLLQRVMRQPMVTGLYLASHVSHNELISLSNTGRYQLLFWNNDYQTGEASDVRFYAGRYTVRPAGVGDLRLSLDIGLHDGSLGSDAKAERLHVRPLKGERAILFPQDGLDSVATAIGHGGTLGRTDDYYRPVSLSGPFAGDDFPELDAPPRERLPDALTSRVLYEPLRVTITHVSEPEPVDPDDEYADDTVMVTLDTGTQAGLMMNMPLYSPADADHALVGWVWGMDPEACRVGLGAMDRPEGKRTTPRIGDVLVTRR